MSFPRVSLPVALFVYIGLLFCLRTFGVSGGSIDDAEQLLYSQSWAWAYSAHNPPGPTWIARALQWLTGPTLVSVCLPKFCWLWLTGYAFHACAQRVLASPERAVLATCWLAGIYYLSWECLLNYSHSVQVLAVSMLITWQALRMRHARSLGDYLLLGLLVALGMVSKFNFAVLLLALVIASLRVPVYRAVLLDARLLLSVLVAIVLMTPMFVAQAQLLSAQAAATTAKFAIASTWSVPLAMTGTISAVKALASWLAPLLLFVVLAAPRVLLPMAWPRHPAREVEALAAKAGVTGMTGDGGGGSCGLMPVLAVDAGAAPPQRFAPGRAPSASDGKAPGSLTLHGGDARDDERWLRWLGFSMLFVVIALVVGSRAAQARTHYFQIAVPLVLWLALRAELTGVSLTRWRVIAGLSLLLAVLAPLLLSLELSGVANITGKSRLVVPYRGLAGALKASGFRSGIVVAEDWPHALSGNLRPWLADSTFLSLAHTDYRPPLPSGDAQCLVLWQSGEAAADAATAPESVQRLIKAPGAEAGLRYGRLSLRTRGRAGATIGIGWALWQASERCLALVGAPP